MNALTRWWRNHQLHSNDPRTRLAAVERLGALGEEARVYTVGRGYQSYAVDMLRNVLRNDRDVDVRSAAARALGKLGLALGGTWVRSYLRAAMLDDNDSVREAAAVGLRQCGEDPDDTEQSWTIAKQSITSPNGRRMASLFADDHGQFLTVDNKQQKRYPWIEQVSLTFSPDSERLAYVAHESDDEFVVIDAIEERRHQKVWGSPLFSPDSQRLAYTVGKKSALTERWKSAVVVDRTRGRFYDHVKGLAFSPNSRFFAYVGANEGPIERTHFGDVRLLSYFFLVVVQRDGRTRVYSIPGRSDFGPEFTEDSKTLNVIDRNAKQTRLTVSLENDFVL